MLGNILQGTRLIKVFSKCFIIFPNIVWISLLRYHFSTFLFALFSDQHTKERKHSPKQFQANILGNNFIRIAHHIISFTQKIEFIRQNLTGRRRLTHRHIEREKGIFLAPLWHKVISKGQQTVTAKSVFTYDYCMWQDVIFECVQWEQEHFVIFSFFLFLLMNLPAMETMALFLPFLPAKSLLMLWWLRYKISIPLLPHPRGHICCGKRELGVGLEKEKKNYCVWFTLFIRFVHW